MGDYQFIPVDCIETDTEQVRRALREESIEGLAQSVREVGMLHPLVVTPLGDGRFRLVSGERRLRAARLLGETTVPALVIRDLRVSPTQIQLIENLQREDLNPVERALGIRALMEREGLSKAAAAARLGVRRTTLTDWLDVLDLDPRYQAALVDNFQGGDSPLTLSHVAEAKALGARLGSPQIVSVLLDAVLEHRLSKSETRRVAQLVRTSENLSIAEAVRIVRGMAASADGKGRTSHGEPARERQGPGAEEAAATGEEGVGSLDGALCANGRGSGLDGGQDAAYFSRLIATLHRFRTLLSQLVAGGLGEMSAPQREQLIEYLYAIRRWIDDVVTFAREVDNPELAAERRRALLKMGKKKRRRSRHTLRSIPAPFPNGATYRPPAVGPSASCSGPGEASRPEA